MPPGYENQLVASPLRRVQNAGRLTRLIIELLCFFQKGRRKNPLICRAAVKLEGRSPESKR
ncbi:MAG: hypothetical protein IJ599_05085 [Alphaproteobacteria bacterium]|nr:hypothetical protein [Alphaproteobacteria bacterium]